MIFKLGSLALHLMIDVGPPCGKYPDGLPLLLVTGSRWCSLGGHGSYHGPDDSHDIRVSGHDIRHCVPGSDTGTAAAARPGGGWHMVSPFLSPKSQLTSYNLKV